MSNLPAITGEQLVKLLEKDGWKNEGKTTHGVSMQKKVNGVHKVVIIPVKKSKSIPDKTLGGILSVKQSGITRSGLERLIETHGI